MKLTSYRKFSVLIMLLLSASGTVPAADSISQDPLFLVVKAQPKVMLSMSNDHQLFIKAYTDYTDLDEDGLPETTYLDTIDYYGYFESNQCYLYKADVRRYKSQGLATGDNSHSCSNTDNWSGNFLNWATMTRMDVIRKVLYGGLRSTDSTTKTVLERAYLPNDSHAFAKVFSTSTQAQMQEFTPYARFNISICNVTFDTDPNQSLSGKISTATSPPLMRIARGKYPSWAASEIHQCAWGSGTRPSYNKRLIYPDPVVRVQVCKSYIANSDCLTYPDGNAKPTGILQENSGNNSKAIDFGLITGSYAKNKSGGVLRKNIVPMLGNNNYDDEYSAETGIFNYLNSSLSDRHLYARGIIQSLDALRIAGWKQSSSKHKYSCDSPGKLTIANGQCVDWGNPLSEIYLETLRYFSGKSSPTAAFNANDSNYIPGLFSQSWQDPISSEQWCADLSVITISTGLNSFDTDQLSNDIDLNTSTWVNKVGTAEGILGQYLIGSGSNNDNKRCTSKQLNNLDDAQGICPEMPTLEGGYHLAGMAYYARTNDLRSDREGMQTLTTYGISLAESLPKFEIPVGSKIVSLLPACRARNNSSTDWRDCSILDLQIKELNSDGTKGAFDVVWEDSSWGNDFDVDGIVRIAFCVAEKCDVNPGTGKLRVTIDLRQIGAGHTLNFGYIVTGTSTDGAFYELSASGNIDYMQSPPSQYVKTKVFSPGTSSAKQLKNPLWYMSKYGNFTELNESAFPVPDLETEWDVLPEGAPDGVPDGYFKATNPAALQDSLNQVFDSIASRRPTSAAIASNSTSLRSNAKIYQARFESDNWGGHLLSYPLANNTGVVGEVLWDAAELIPVAANRKIFSLNTQTQLPVVFQHGNLGAVQQGQLSAAQVAYLRGDRSAEGTTFRQRASLLGDIINANPLYAGRENFNYSSMSDYSEYLLGSSESWDKNDRQQMLYVGANDGMLHGFLGSGDTSEYCDITISDCEGEEVFSYIPKALYSNLAKLTSTNYQHQFYVDGSPTYSDAYLNYEGTSSRWGSVLVGTLAAGGKGIFALDISDPMNFSSADVLWDKDNTDTGMADLGFTFSRASIVKMANGKWVAVFGNGYQSANHKAVLYIVDLRTGALIKKIAAGTQGNSTLSNGLSTPIVIDSNADKIADTIYAGDLYGNLWKFDVSSSSVSNWGVALQNEGVDQPLFTACSSESCTSANIQPITAKPEVIKASGGGKLVLFGTGKYFSASDRSVGTNVNSFYAIKDLDVAVTARSELLAQSIITSSTVQADSLVTFKAGFRLTTNYIDSTKQGWYLDFDDSRDRGERVVADSVVANGTVLFTTIIPDTAACSDGGSSIFMLLDAQSGARSSTHSFDFTGNGTIDAEDKIKYDDNGDGVIDGSDVAVAASGRRSNLGMANTPSTVGNKLYVGGTGSDGDDTGIEKITIESNSARTGRISWTQLK